MRVEVFRCLGPEIGEVWEARLVSREGLLLGTETITSRPDWLDRTSHFSKSRWSGNVFEIVANATLSVEYRLSVSKYLE